MPTDTTEKPPIELVIQQQPSVALLDPRKKAELYDFLEREIAAFVPDTSTETGRKKIASLAYKVARTKTAIDDAGAALKAEWLKKSQAVDASRREIREKLDALKDKARAPLTEWEAAEEKAIADAKSMLDRLKNYAIIQSDFTADRLRVRLAELGTINITPGVYLAEECQQAGALAIAAISSAIIRIEQEEKDRAELARLRAEKEARDAADRKAAEEAELARLTKEREERELVRLAEKAEAEKRAEEQRREREKVAIAQAAKDAEEKTRLEAQQEAERTEQRHRDALEAQKRERLEAERLVREEQAKAELEHKRELEEARRIANEADARERQARQKQMQDEANAATKAAEEKKLAANKKHRQDIMTAAKEALINACGVDEEQARKIVLAISTGKIPAVELRFV